MTTEPAAPLGQPPAARRCWPMKVVVVGALALGLIAWWQQRSAPVENAPSQLPRGDDYVRIDLFVDPQEWGPEDPTVCEIAARYGLDSDALAATLHDYAGRSGCAAPDTRIRRGSHVVIAVTAFSPYPHCKALAVRPCRIRQ